MTSKALEEIEELLEEAFEQGLLATDDAVLLQYVEADEVSAVRRTLENAVGSFSATGNTESTAQRSNKNLESLEQGRNIVHLPKVTRMSPEASADASPRRSVTTYRGAILDKAISEKHREWRGRVVVKAYAAVVLVAIGMLATALAIYISLIAEDRRAGSLISSSFGPPVARATGNLIEENAAPLGEKADRIKVETGGLTTRYIIKDQDNVVERRNGSDFNTYVRISAWLATVKPTSGRNIPPFNPFDFYISETSSQGNTTQHTGPGDADHNQFLTSRFVDISGEIPDEDNQTLTEEEVKRLLAEINASYAESATPPFQEIPLEDKHKQQSIGTTGESSKKSTILPRITTIEKLSSEHNAHGEVSIESVTAAPGDTLVGILRSFGVDVSQAQSIDKVFSSISSGPFELSNGENVRVQLAYGATDPSQAEPVKVSVFSGITARGTVIRNDDGEFRLSDDPVQITHMSDDGTRPTLYASIYNAALAQELQPDIILMLLRVMIYDVDFTQKTRSGDSFEMFFDVSQGIADSKTIGQLVYVGMNIGSKTFKYYRYQTPDGQIGFYNPMGGHPRKFLLPSPLHGGRLISDYGYRRHPLLGNNEFHTGVDLAASVGTPVVAAGDGAIEIVGQYARTGNYIRIRHANGYKTAYSHMGRIASGIKEGAKIRQGELIGYVGSTGIVMDSFLHYEVLINSRFADPLGVHKPRGRQLHGRLLSDFRKEVARLEDLMHRTPISTRVVAVAVEG
jgi:murein DD-endopeptidase MepM/ murein hydrolase activator NlpD